MNGIGTSTKVSTTSLVALVGALVVTFIQDAAELGMVSSSLAALAVGVVTLVMGHFVPEKRPSSSARAQFNRELDEYAGAMTRGGETASGRQQDS